MVIAVTRLLLDPLLLTVTDAQTAEELIENGIEPLPTHHKLMPDHNKLSDRDIKRRLDEKHGHYLLSTWTEKLGDRYYRRFVEYECGRCGDTNTATMQSVMASAGCRHCKENNNHHSRGRLRYNDYVY